MQARDAATALLFCYAAAVTLAYCGWRQRLNPLCTRDFVEPASDGSCLCNSKAFCLCTPSLASDIIIELEDGSGVVFVERKDGRGLALVGGFVKVGEEAGDAAIREALEETGLSVRKESLRLFCLFSSPRRDPRRHTAAAVHVAVTGGTPQASDDAKATRVVPISQLQHSPPRFAFDHGQIVAAYVERFHPPPPGSAAAAAVRKRAGDAAGACRRVP